MQILPYIEESTVSEDAFRTYTSIANADAYGPAMDSLNSLLLPMYLCPSDPELTDQQKNSVNARSQGHELCRRERFVLRADRNLSCAKGGGQLLRCGRRSCSDFSVRITTTVC